MIKPALIGTIVFMTGCATTLSDVSRAQAYCQNNGGLNQIAQRYNSTVSITCANGARFKFASNEGTK